MEQYVLKYNDQDDLYCYIEKNDKGKILSYYSLVNNRLVRYDSEQDHRSFVEFIEPCRMSQRFSDGESWITVIRKEEYRKTIQVNFPNKKKEYCVQGCNIVSFTVSKKFIIECQIKANTANYSDKVFPEFKEEDMSVSSEVKI